MTAMAVRSDVAARGSCPQCGAELPLGRGGGTVTCAFCNLTSSYTVVPVPVAPSRSEALEAITLVPLYASRNALIVGWTPRTLEACDPVNGRPVWAVTMPRTSRPIVASFERVYVPTDGNELVAIDAASGSIAFVATLPAPTSHVDGVPCIADVTGPMQARSRILVHAGTELLALDRMSGAIVGRWPAEPPRLWLAAAGFLLVGPVTTGQVWLVDPQRAVPLAAIPVAPGAALGGAIASGHAFLATSAGEHAAIQLADGALAWRAAAPWNPMTGARAAFARELFVANEAAIAAMPGGTRITTTAPIDDVRMIAGTVIADAGSQLLAYQRTGALAWQLELRDFEDVRIADNGRMLVVVLGRGGQHWIRGLLPTTGKPRWNVLVPDTSVLVRHSLVGDLVLIETEHQRYVLRADTGQVLRSARR